MRFVRRDRSGGCGARRPPARGRLLAELAGEVGGGSSSSAAAGRRCHQAIARPAITGSIPDSYSATQIAVPTEDRDRPAHRRQEAQQSQHRERPTATASATASIESV